MNIRKIARKLAHSLKRYDPKLYDDAIKMLSSKKVRTVRNLHKVPGERRLIRKNLPVFAADMSGRQGFGSTLSWAVEVLKYCDTKRLIPALRFTNSAYAEHSGQDWLPLYFEHKGEIAELTHDRYIDQSVNLRRYLDEDSSALSVQRAHDLFFAVLDFQQQYYEAVDRFCAEQGIGSHTVGVHFRGTDKRLEATRPDWGAITSEVERRSSSGSNIFVATDEPEFLEYMRAHFGRSTICDLDCQEIFPGTSAHLTEGDKSVKASEAIRTIITLSRCGVLVRTRSHLSAWSKILNPALPVVVFGEMLSGDQVGFPETAIQTDAKATI